MKAFVFLFLCLPLSLLAQKYDFLPLNSGTNTSIRGLSVVSDRVAWVSGSNGSIGKTIDGGKTWQWIKPTGYEKLDFRDIEAFDEFKAVVMNAGSPAFILRTVDGGKTWKETYKNTDSAIFLDGMGFWDEKNGIAFGDPIHNRLQLLKTRDGGLNWQNVSDHLNMDMGPGEAGFAASGTSIRTLGKEKVWIATGGTSANIYYSDNRGYTWKRYPCPILQGEASTGSFSVDFNENGTGVVVGGDYQKDKEHPNNVLLSKDWGKTWNKPLTPVSGFRSGVAYIDAVRAVAVGTSGVDFSRDGGKNWLHLSDLNFNAVGKAKKGSFILLAGNNGLIYRLKSTDK
ncbi:WD40/YVTN/BNR-like repeat-containing protein [Pedobacter sp.]|jgi:photosystem II stability/assembly factor-like uncharacterized protein|uniref:WD40/YVTN/BNR-like repeat-containing protein n=1 Tax=Pedobacter sp. TaxID=1411316 RepID=UPI002B76A436|nr:YCF48-related protein [Pedobacter sp.]HWW42149.1 YCF48-related protein [Pedobacter sp.]